MGTERERFRKLFPHLSEEIEKGTSKVKIDQVEPNGTQERKWAGYNPDVIDFIRRCDTDDQAREIIDYLEKKEEIAPEKAAQLRLQLSEKGLRSFGEKKEPGFYHKDA